MCGRYDGSMASGRPITGERNRSTAIVAIRERGQRTTRSTRIPGCPTSTNGAGPSGPESSHRAIYEPIYSKWFRAEWEGLEKIPTEGGALLLVANHDGGNSLRRPGHHARD